LRAAPISYPPAPRRSVWSPTSSPIATHELPNWNSISISGYHIREAGSTGRSGSGLHLRPCDDVRPGRARRPASRSIGSASGCRFFFNAHNNFLEEIAKFRAARRLWATIMREIGSTRPTPRPSKLRFSHPDRRQYADRAAAGQQHCGARPSRRSPPCSAAPSRFIATAATKQLALPTEESGAPSPLRTQQIIAAESGVTNTVDSAGRLVRDRGR